MTERHFSTYSSYLFAVSMFLRSEALKTLLAQPKPIRTITAVLTYSPFPIALQKIMSGFFIVILDHECGIGNIRTHTFEITSMKKTLDPDTMR